MKSLYTLLAMLLFISSATAQQVNEEAPFFSGELIVRLHDNDKLQVLLNDYRLINGQESGFEVIRQLSAPMRIWHLRFDDAVVSNYDFLRAVRRHSAVELAQFNHEVTMRSTVPNDPQFDSQWHHVNSNGSDIDSDLAWDITTGGQTAFGDEIVVCVIEGGNLNHPDLVDNKWVNENEIPGNGIDDDGNGYIDDYNGWNVGNQSDAGVFTGNHGTQVMGMIGAKGNNDLGVAGVNWDVKIMSVAGESLFNEASVVAAYNYPLVMRNLYHESGGEKGAFVVATNASWGIDNADPADHPLWCAVYDDLGEAGILSCGATANNNVNIDVVGDMPTGCASPYMVAVTASNNNDVRTFSGYGVNTIDLAAPGEAVFTTSGQSNYGATSGTSFASPLTAGAIALIYSTPCPSFAALIHADPQAGADYVYEVLMGGVDPVDNLTNEVISGGRLNVYNSIQLVLAGCSDSDCFTPFGVGVTGDAVNGYSINWGGTAAMVAFNVRYREVGADEWIEINNLDTTTYDLPELLWCTEYEAQVMSICEAEESIWSAVQTWLTDGCCELPDASTVELSEVTDNAATISWGAVLAADSYIITLTSESGESETFDNIINTSFIFSGLEPCTMYTVSLGVNCGDETIDAMMAASFITFGCGPCADMDFCLSNGGTEDEWIQRVQLIALDHNSGNDGGYGDFTMNTNLSTSLDPGGTYEITLTPGFSGASYNEIWRVWIDYNGDGIFQENEIVFTSPAPTNNAISGEFNVPVTTEAGSVRMRVSMKYAGFFGSGTPPTPCEEMQFGEVEDYCVEITDEIVNVIETQRAEWAVYPNPTRGLINVDLPEGLHTIEIFDLTGRMVVQQPSQGIVAISMEHLTGGIYMVRLVTDGIPRSTKRVVLNR